MAQIIARFGAPAEVLTDRGAEWDEDFAMLLQQCFIDHRRTSAGRPQTDGLAERAVQTLKRALRRMCEQHNDGSWEKHLPWITLGYRCSRQASSLV